MHPYHSGEIARLRAIELAREANATRTVPIRPPVSPAGFLTTATLRWSAAARLHDRVGPRSRSGDTGIRQTLGLAVIRIGMRIVDPGRVLTHRAVDRTT